MWISRSTNSKLNSESILRKKKKNSFTENILCLSSVHLEKNNKYMYVMQYQETLNKNRKKGKRKAVKDYPTLKGKLYGGTMHNV